MLTSHTFTIRPSEIKDAAQLMELDALVWDKYTSPAPMHWRSRQHYLQHCPPGSQLIAVQESGYVVMWAFSQPQVCRSTVMSMRFILQFILMIGVVELPQL